MKQILFKKLWAEFKYWAISLFILAFLFEMISSMVLYRKYATSKLAILHLTKNYFNNRPDQSLYHRMHEMVRPDSTPEMTRRIADEIWDANKYTYEPWLMFKVIDYQSKYVNVNGFERRSIPAEYINPSSTDTIDIYFFGGSTMYGYNVSDAETIPSQFMKIYQKENPGGKSVRIKNFGIPYYYSKQELILLTKLLFEGNRPDVVIFFDGLNDFYPSRMLYYDRPHFSYAMQQAFDGKMFQKANRSIIDTSDQFYIDPPGIDHRDYYDALYNKYVYNITHAAALCFNAGIRSYFFCQPVPFYKYTNRANDLIAYKVNYDRFDHIYPKLEKSSESIKNFFFLGNMLEQEKGKPFVDQVHYSPAFSEQIAKKLYLTVKKDLQ